METPWRILVLGVLMGCAGQSSPDPCREMMREVRNRRAVERDLNAVEREILRDSLAGDSTALARAIRRRSVLKERAYYSKIAAENWGADCAPTAGPPGAER